MYLMLYTSHLNNSCGIWMHVTWSLPFIVIIKYSLTMYKWMAYLKNVVLKIVAKLIKELKEYEKIYPIIMNLYYKVII